MSLLPTLEGSASIHAQNRGFVAAFVRRIETGLLHGTSDRRSRYVVTRADDAGLAFRAADWPTALNVGLNDVELDVSASGSVRYRIRYARWACYALGLSACIAGALAAFFVLLDLRAYITRNYGPQYLGLTVDQSVALAWAMAAFWGFVWPWILIALHKRPLRRLLERIIAEVDTA